MASGLKSVRNRRDDALSRIAWDRLESMLAEHYRRDGYDVEHVGTGGSGRKFDGGIDLKLRRDDAYILVQCKHWNAYKVPHNDVHQLLGLMVNEGATGAILVTSGEFTRAAIEAATRQGHVQLVDGDDLRAMLGPLPESTETEQVTPWGESVTESAVDRAARLQAGRHISRSPARLDDESKLVLIKLALAGFVMLVFFWSIGRVFSSLRQIPIQQQERIQAVADAAQAAQAAQRPSAPQPTPATPAAAAVPASDEFAAHSYGRRDPDPCHELVDWRSGTYIDHCRQGAPHRPTAAEIRESQRKADEAIKVIADSTPDM